MKTTVIKSLLASTFISLGGMALAEGSVEFWDNADKTISVPAPALYPEGIELHPKTGEFLLGSIRQGKVIALAEDGSTRTLVEDERLRSVVGIRVDAARNRLLVNSSDYGVAERSTPEDKFATMNLGVYDLDSGAPVLFVNLAGLRAGESHFANDLAVDADGNAYITDSLAAAIYKVTPAGDASVFLTHEDFRGKGFNLNGIQVHPDGYLLVAKKSDGALFRVPLDRPADFTRVDLPRPLVGTDGLLLVNEGELVVITNLASGVESNTVFSVSSSDGWTSATIQGQFETGDVYPTTGTVKDGKVFVNYGRLNTLGATLKDNGALLDSFVIQEVGQLK